MLLYATPYVAKMHVKIKLPGAQRILYQVRRNMTAQLGTEASCEDGPHGGPQSRLISKGKQG